MAGSGNSWGFDLWTVEIDYELRRCSLEVLNSSFIRLEAEYSDKRQLLEGEIARLARADKLVQNFRTFSDDPSSQRLKNTCFKE